MSAWHKELNHNAGDLDPRILAIVLDELRRDLRTRHERGRYFYDRNHGDHFWKEKAGDFAKAAEEVLKERRDSGRSVVYIAKYLYHGFGATTGRSKFC